MKEERTWNDKGAIQRYDEEYKKRMAGYKQKQK